MGFLDDAMKAARKAAGAASEAASGAASKTGYGKAGAPPPDMDALVTDEEIEQVTGAAPKGEPRRNGEKGSETDLGRLIIRESKLDNGDKFLVTVSNCTDDSAARLAMDRMAEVEKPLDGVGERGLVRVKKYPKTGSSEVGVTALKGSRTLSLTHTSEEGKTDAGPLTELVKKALERL